MRDLVIIAIVAGVALAVFRPDIARRGVSKLRGLAGGSCCDDCAKGGATCGGAPNLAALGVDVGDSSSAESSSSSGDLDDIDAGERITTTSTLRGCAS